MKGLTDPRETAIDRPYIGHPIDGWKDGDLCPGRGAWGGGKG